LFSTAKYTAVGAKFWRITALVAPVPAAVNQISVNCAVIAMTRITAKRDNVNNVARAVFYQVNVHFRFSLFGLTPYITPSASGIK
jgi:hypothetical protein